MSVLIPKKKCIVPGCDDKYSTRHRFPKRPEDHSVFKMWLKRISNPLLFSLTKEKIYLRYSVCDRHFDEDCRVPGWIKLRRGSVPSLFLPDFPEKQTSVSEINGTSANRVAGSLIHDHEYACDSETTQIDLPLNERDSLDLQVINSADILSNLSSYELQMIDAEDTFLSISSSKNTRENEPSTNQDAFKETNNNTETPSQLEHEIHEEVSNEICDNDASSDIIQIEIEAPASEKPYFKSVKSYLLDSRCITEVCRICFRSILNEEMIKLYEEEQNEDARKIKNMLKLVLPDLDLEMYPNSVVCTKCMELVVYSYELKETWLTTEEKLQKIIDKKKGMTKRDADLVIVAKAMSKVEQDNVAVRNRKESGTITTKVMQDILNCSNSVANVEISVLHGDLEGEERSEEAKKVKKKGRFDTKVWGLGPYICEICGVVMTKLRRFKFHVERHHMKKSERAKSMCELCGKFFRTVGVLKLHLQKHSNSKLECSICNKVFKYNGALQLHIRQRHLKLYNYIQCHLCGKQLAYKGSLWMHLLTHNPKKRFSCHLCKKSFNMPSHLRKHLARHTSQKFKCEYCEKSIKYESTLRKHIQIYHMNEGEYVCKFCDRPYWKKVDLIKHKIRIHGWAPDVESNRNN